ncbi:MAG TPA: hypothetical protein DDX39_02935 [Bacteroidales bacterium]|nr:MAG: hypothetical protein A2W98_02950 [Bacteroidetes bacterium GWF2_33_38]OFY70043.1 MAG: hypothetical protein A2265_04995 [Bacteroidetes bacterium RIFOXYA12_FULL_33_9]OFY88206.1 MAG: hypothetical protein A2236_07765 [Bacteroidetes bacterium RIFOXYA2_FULL_33_7]HBF87573.1 hypothetical protein [Bacteroidales bacterium]
MANIRNLKKDINYLTSELVSDCYLYMYFHKDKNHDEVVGIISEAVELRNNLMHKTNHPENKDDKKLLKSHFNNLYDEMLESVDVLFNQLSELTKK